MKLIFAGTPEFAAQALAALIQAGHDIALVLTQPDRPAGRGMKLKPSPVKVLALEHGLRVEQPLSLKHADAQAMLQQVDAELMVVAAYGLLLPQAVLDIPARGCLNIHASLLPRWRGAAPIQRALLAGDAETGITIMQMDAGLDTGAIRSLHRLPIAADDTAASLHDKLAQLGAEAIVAALATLDQLPTIAQPSEGVTYAHKLEKAEAEIDWQQQAACVVRRILAYHPVPGAFSQWQGQGLKVWRASIVNHDSPATTHTPAGTVCQLTPEGAVVQCGQGQVCLEELQLAGGKRLSGREFFAGRTQWIGTTLGATPA